MVRCISRVLFVLLFGISIAIADETINGSGTSWDKSDITVLVGESVTWTWSGSHTSTSTTGNNCTGSGLWNYLNSGESQIFNSIGNSFYMCSFHCGMGMKGVVRVVDYDISCAPATVGSSQGGSGSSTCTVTSLNGLTLPVTLSTTDLPAGVTASFNTNPVSPPANGTEDATLTLDVDGTVGPGSYPFTLKANATSGSSTPGNREKTFSMTLNVTTGIDFTDSFDDADLSDWTFLKKGNWSSPAGALIGSAIKKGIALAPHIMSTTSSIEADMLASGGDGNLLSLYGWYVDNRNLVQLIMKPENDKWILKVKINGGVVLKAKGIRQIDPGVSYHAAISYDGSAFHVAIDGIPLIDTNPAPLPFVGQPGFLVKAGSGTFAEIHAQE